MSKQDKYFTLTAAMVDWALAVTGSEFTLSLCHGAVTVRACTFAVSGPSSINFTLMFYTVHGLFYGTDQVANPWNMSLASFYSSFVVRKGGKMGGWVG